MWTPLRRRALLCLSKKFHKTLLKMRNLERTKGFDPSTATLQNCSHVLRIGVTTTVLHTLLPTLVAAINAAFPAVDLELQVTITPDMTARLAG